MSLPTSTRQLPCLRKAIPAAQPSFSMKSGVIGYSPTRPRMPSVPKYFLLIGTPMYLFGVLYRSNHAYHIDSFGHVMDTKDARPLVMANAASARLPYKRSPTGRSSVRPIMLFRDTPTSSGRPRR